MFIDDIAFVADNHQVARFAKSATAFEQKINLKKSKVMCQPLPRSPDIDQDIQTESQDRPT